MGTSRVGVRSAKRTCAIVVVVVLLFALAVPAGAVEPTTWQTAMPLVRISATVDGGQPNEDSFMSALSDDARYVVYQSDATNIAPEDTNNGRDDIFMYDTVSMETTLVSMISSTAVDADRGSRDPSISDDGRHVAFFSGKNFVPEDTNGDQDLYVKDMTTGEYMLADITGDGSSPGSEIEHIYISGDGSRVVMESYYDEHPDDSNGLRDIYLWDMESNETTIVSMPTSVTTDPDRGSREPSISDDGRYVAFLSGVDFIASDTNGGQDIYVKDMTTGEYMRADIIGDGTSSVGRDVWDIKMSGDGSVVVFESRDVIFPEAELNGSTRDVYLWDMASDEATLVSAPREDAVDFDRGSRDAGISDDGRFVSFFSGQDFLANDTNSLQDLYVKDMSNGTYARIELAPYGDSPTDNLWDFAMSGNGQYVSFSSSQLLVRPDRNAADDVFLKKLMPTVAEGSFRADGDNRYETAIAMSQEAFPEGANTVVIATGADWPDALGGSALAGAAGGPILLTAPDSLTPAVADEIERLGAMDVYILGGYSAVSLAVENDLADIVPRYVKRLSGADRYGTSKAVANEAITLMGYGYDGTICVATGANYPDAMAAAPLAAGLGWPIVLANPGSGSVFVPYSAKAAIILGGTGAVGSSVESGLKTKLGADAVERADGETRYETAALIAARGVEGGLVWNGVGIASGEAFPDALAGGASLGALRTVMLLTPSAALDPYASAALEANKADIVSVKFLGGTAALSSGVQTAVEILLGL